MNRNEEGILRDALHAAITSRDAAESQIAALKVDLAAMQRQRDLLFSEMNKAKDERDAARAERDNANVAREVEWKRAQGAEAELTQAREEIARLNAVANEASDLGAEKDRSYYRVCMERQSAQAALCRAVAALQEAKPWMTCFVAYDSAAGREYIAAKAAVNAILADPTSAQAGEAWGELETLVRDIAREDVTTHPAGWGTRARALLAAVDARRGGGR